MSDNKMTIFAVGEGKNEQAFPVVDPKAIHFDGPQDLTPEEQALARANTGAVSAEEVVAIVDAKLSSITNAEEVAY